MCIQTYCEQLVGKIYGITKRNKVWQQKDNRCEQHGYSGLEYDGVERDAIFIELSQASWQTSIKSGYQQEACKDAVE
jgi:hypothetical protein